MSTTDGGSSEAASLDWRQASSILGVWCVLLCNVPGAVLCNVCGRSDMSHVWYYSGM